MTDLPVKPHRKTLRQTAIILNVSIRTVRRYLGEDKLIWSGNQVSLESIINYLKRDNGDETDHEVSEKVDKAVRPEKRKRRAGSGFVRNY